MRDKNKQHWTHEDLCSSKDGRGQLDFHTAVGSCISSNVVTLGQS